MNKKYTASALELAIVLLITQIAFVWAKCTALLERGYTAYGGEYLFLLIPAIYYITKQIAIDWIAGIKKRRGGGKRGPCKGCRCYCGGGSSNRWTCDYILIEHHRRPCPPGKDCTVKKARKRKGAVKHGETI